MDYDGLGFSDAREFEEACKSCLDDVAAHHLASPEASALASRYLETICRNLETYVEELDEALVGMRCPENRTGSLVVSVADNAMLQAIADLRLVPVDSSVEGMLARLRTRLDDGTFVNWSVLCGRTWPLFGRDADWDEFMGILAPLPINGDPPDYRHFDANGEVLRRRQEVRPLGLRAAFDWACEMCRDADGWLATHPDYDSVSVSVSTVDLLGDGEYVFLTTVLGVEFTLDTDLGGRLVPEGYADWRYLQGHESQVKKIWQAAGIEREVQPTHCMRW